MTDTSHVPSIPLKKVEIDVEQGIYKVNGRDISNATYLRLIFDGVWSLEITEDNVYSTSDLACGVKE